MATWGLYQKGICKCIKLEQKHTEWYYKVQNTSQSVPQWTKAIYWLLHYNKLTRSKGELTDILSHSQINTLKQLYSRHPEKIYTKLHKAINL